MAFAGNEEALLLLCHLFFFFFFINSCLWFSDNAPMPDSLLNCEQVLVL